MTSGTLPKLNLEKVVVLGANGAMGAGAAAMFASGGCQVTVVSRDQSKNEGAIRTVQGIAKAERITDSMKCATYSEGMNEAIAGADLVFEAVAEEMGLKRQILAQVDGARSADALVATVSSGLSIVDMVDGMSDGMKSHFAGIHLFNPPHVMIGTELIPHPDMPGEVTQALAGILTDRFGRSITICVDSPAFAGNRIGFKVLNEVAQLAETYGVQYMDTLVGPYTGRAMAPLATVDLVGWDVHQAIVDNVYANTNDEAHEIFKLPGYMADLIGKGHLGDKTPEKGGFFQKSKDGTLALDAASGTYKPLDADLRFDFVEEVRDLHHRGRYKEAVASFMDASGPEAELARRVILGYVSYALNRFGPGEVVAAYDDVDRIMSAGFNWVPPSGLVDIIGVERTIKELERLSLPVPSLLKAAAKGEVATPLFNLPFVTPGRYFAG
jgi:3-hydroxyacyl-CoA dehydrogenase